MLLCLLAALAAPMPAPTPPLPPDKIFANARLAMYLRNFPRYVRYVVDVQSTAYGKHYHEGYELLLRTHDDTLAVEQDPIYTSNKPPQPYGFSFFGINKQGKAPDHIEPPFGVPLMSATYDFGLAVPPAPKNEDERSAQARARVLGHVEVLGKEYGVSYLGEETVDGHATYHLALTPLDHPDFNRVREIWVDTKTFNVWKLVTQGIFAGGPAAGALWTVNFIDLHGWWFIRTESTRSTFTLGGHLFGGATTYDGVTYTFGDYAYPGFISDLEFQLPPVSTDAVQE
jgi:hypothetical protein